MELSTRSVANLMRTYYVTIPDSDFPAAEVEASSTKHARTAYLDYLSRSSLISWSERQKVRRKIIASLTEPGEFNTSVQLRYRVGATTQGVSLEEEEELEDEELGSEYPISSTEEPVSTPQARPYFRPREGTILGSRQGSPPRSPGGFLSDSPIARISRQSRGM